MNDFEPAVFRQHPRLRRLKRRLERMGARPALLSGSGSALCGIFETAPAVEQARRAFRSEEVFAITLVSRARYRALWRRRLGAHIAGKLWPPQSRYV